MLNVTSSNVTDTLLQSLAGDGRQNLSREEREKLRLSFFKQPKAAATEEAA
jgi:hypothetical protein